MPGQMGASHVLIPDSAFGDPPTLFFVSLPLAGPHIKGSVPFIKTPVILSIGLA